MPKGFKAGGRKAGTPNKSTAQQREKLKQLALDGKDPITFFSTIMRDDNAPYEERKFAATQLLPYYHPKLASIEARSGGLSHEDRLAELTRLLVASEGENGA